MGFKRWPSKSIERVANTIIMGLDARKPVFAGFANNSGADQPAHPRSLISAFVICVLESTRSKPGTSEISVVSVAEETGFSLVFVGNPEDRVCRDEAPKVSPFPAVVLFDLSEF